MLFRSTLANKNATIAPTFNLIQLDYENIQAVQGGTLVGSAGSYTGLDVLVVQLDEVERRRDGRILVGQCHILSETPRSKHRPRQWFPPPEHHKFRNKKRNPVYGKNCPPLPT